ISCGRYSLYALSLLQNSLDRVQVYRAQHQNCNFEGFEILADRLMRIYGPRHKAIVYEAAIYPIFQPVIQRVPLNRLTKAEITTASLLYVPPSRMAPWDHKMAKRLKL